MPRNRNLGKGLRLLLVLCIMALPVMALGEDAPVYRRMAIIGDSSVQKSGVTDLLAIDLQQAGVELVERDKLAAVVNEQTLAAALGADSAKNRVVLGKLVQADALVLLEQADNGDGKSLHMRLVIAECHQGARLCRDSLAIRSPEKMAREIAELVLATRKRFAGGVTGIIGVPPFIARNFTYEYHPLQKGYAALLEDALGATPGVAVLDIDEAQAIRKELETSGGKAAGVVPILVEGEFEVIAAQGQLPAVNFKITLETSEQSRTVERKGLSLDDAPDYIWRELPAQVLPDYERGVRHPFTPEVEFARLIARADEFASLGEWRHAIDLRQAALVIHPEDAGQRSKLVGESIKVLTHFGPDAIAPRAGTLQTNNSHAAAILESCFENTEWLIHAGRKESIGYGENLLRVSGYLDQSSPNAQDMRNQRRRFLQNVWPLTYDLGKTTDRNSDDAFSLNWSDTTVQCAVFPHGMEQEDFDILYKLLDEVIPEAERIPAGLVQFLCEYDRTNSLPEFFHFLDRLEHSTRVNNRLLAVVARVSWHQYWERDISDQMLAQIDAVIVELLQTSPSKDLRRNGPFNMVMDLRQRVMSDRESIAARTHAATQPALSTRPTAPPAGNLPSRDIVAGPIRFEDVPFRYKQISGMLLEQRPAEGYAGMDHLITCTDSLDVFWDRNTIVVMRELGTLQAIMGGADAMKSHFHDVLWDGQHLWASTTAEQIQEFDMDGKVLVSLGQAEGLPPINIARLAALAPDRIMVAGAFGPTNRAFLALITREQDAWRVNVFHKASRVVEAASRDKDSFDADLAFVPSQMFVCRSPGGVECVVIKREAAFSKSGDHPLIVNAKTLSVTACPTDLGPYGFAPCGGGLLQTQTERDLLLWTPGDDCVFHRVFEPTRFGFIPFYIESLPSTTSPDGIIYSIGQMCMRIDPKTMSATRLARVKQRINLEWGYSKHFGLIAWDRGQWGPGRMYRVTVDEDAVRQLPASEQFDPAPPEAGKTPDGMWLKIISAGAKTMAVGDPFSGPMLVRNVGHPIRGNSSMRVSVKLFLGKSAISHSSYPMGMVNNESAETAGPWGIYPEGAAPHNSRSLQATEPGEYRVEISVADETNPDLIFDTKSFLVTVK